MKGDFTRSSFNPRKHYSSVRMQQGRVQLDTDWNEQIEIAQHQGQTQLADLLGVGGAPALANGFEITEHKASVSELNSTNGTWVAPDFVISAGHFYVDGILCENDEPCHYLTQTDFPGAGTEWGSGEAQPQQFLVYLDVWPRHITNIEDPDLQEVALDGLDSTTRTKTTWQVKLLPIEGDVTNSDLASLAAWQQLMVKQAIKARGQLTARQTKDIIIQQNQLYRVEIHQSDATHTTCKWSRENGSVVYPVEKITPVNGSSTLYEIQLKDLNPDKLALEIGDWVELADDDVILNGKPSTLFQVASLQPDVGKVRLASTKSYTPDPDPAAKHTLLRRWEQRERDGQTMLEGALVLPGDETRTFTMPVSVPASGVNTALINFPDELDAGQLTPAFREQLAQQGIAITAEAHVQTEQSGSRWTLVDLSKTYPIQRENDKLTVSDKFITLENGITISFSGGNRYEVGDYWLIPARANLNDGTGGIVWPPNKAMPPLGIEHHYAPLALLRREAGVWKVVAKQVNTEFASLPQLTTLVKGLDGRLTHVEGEIQELQVGVQKLIERVIVLEHRMDRVEKRLAIQRTQLFQDFLARGEPPIEVGMVVAFAQLAEHDGQATAALREPLDYIEAATTANATLLLGVVIELDPHHHHGQPADQSPVEQRYRVAMQGRTRCKVVGPVKPGALLIPSDVAGHAEQAGLYLQPGTVLGKALSAFTPDSNEAAGTVDVLITLN